MNENILGKQKLAKHWPFLALSFKSLKLVFSSNTILVFARGRFVEHLSRTQVAQQSVTKIMTILDMTVVPLCYAASPTWKFNKLNPGNLPIS